MRICLAQDPMGRRGGGRFGCIHRHAVCCVGKEGHEPDPHCFEHSPLPCLEHRLSSRHSLRSQQNKEVKSHNCDQRMVRHNNFIFV